MFVSLYDVDTPRVSSELALSRSASTSVPRVAALCTRAPFPTTTTLHTKTSPVNRLFSTTYNPLPPSNLPMAARTVAKISQRALWTGDKGCWPVATFAAGASVMACYAMYRQASSSVDVHWSRSGRSTATYMRDDFEAGQKFRDRVETHMVKDSVNNMQYNAPPLFSKLYRMAFSIPGAEEARKA